MRSIHRAMTVAVSAVVLLSAAAIGSSSKPSAAQPAAPPPGFFAPCIPAKGDGVIKDPPLWVPTAENHHTITLHARQNGDNAFCYVADGLPALPYSEAPTIQVHQGETFTLILKNELKVAAGATAMAGMTPHPAPTATDGCDQMGTMSIPPDNSSGVLGVASPDPRLKADMEKTVGDTNLHTHGWDVSPAVDNVFKSTTNSKSSAGPRSCVYVFVVPSSQTAGTYWYHAHMHGVSNKQVGGGLAGALIVLPKTGPVPDSRVLIIKNLTTPPSKAPIAAVLQAGTPSRALLFTTAADKTPVPSPTFPAPPTPEGKAAVWSGISFDGNERGACGWGPGATPAPKAPSIPTMVNGIPIPQPGSTTPPGKLLIDKEQRVRVINASANNYVTLFMRVGASGTENLQVVARDGVDLDNTSGEALPLLFKRLLLGPGNRADILVAPGTTQRTLMSGFTCTGALGLSDPTQAIATIPAVPTLRHTLAAVHALSLSQTKAAAFVAKFSPKVVRQRELTFTQYDGFTHFYVTDTTNRGAKTFGERPLWLQASAHPNDPDHYMLPNITVTQDDTEVWTLVNAAAEIHAFHIHQMTFTTLSTDDPELMSQLRGVLLDVVPLAPAKYVPGAVFVDPLTGFPYPAVTPTRTRILINFGVVHPGTFVYHCHMLAHEDAGMMGIITVLPRKVAAR
ncbi:MAG: multicopper oxidase type 2 [Candidatus Eremiobacteraeota bacterium]|nr:multicopper oxidase type 2 [Candidatus Eremiobacteraeota bacterium]